MSDPRPGAVNGDAPWPLLAAVVERSGDAALVTFEVSDVAPETAIGSVVLGVDLTDAQGGRFALLARFEAGHCTVSTSAGGRSTLCPDATVHYSDGAVTVRAELPELAEVDGPGSAAFCFLSGVPYQVDVPVVRMPTSV